MHLHGKVGKEEIIGMLKTLEIYSAEDEQALAMDQWRQATQILWANAH
jgi:hypothetical protein